MRFGSPSIKDVNGSTKTMPTKSSLIKYMKYPYILQN